MADLMDDDLEKKVSDMLLEAREARGKARYEWAAAMLGGTPETPWEELSAEQKRKVYEEMDRHTREMNELGQAISEGRVNTVLIASVIASNL